VAFRHDGQITGIVSSSKRKNILLYRNSDLRYKCCRPAPTEGRFAIVTLRRVRDAVDAASVRCFCIGRNASSGRRSRVVLAPRPWRYVGGKYPAGNGGKKGRSPGRARISRKPLRGESWDVSAVPVVKPVCISVALFAHGTAGAVGARLSLRPLSERGTTRLQNPGENAPRERSRLFEN
jgi:hypothetical protein